MSDAGRAEATGQVVAGAFTRYEDAEAALADLRGAGIAGDAARLIAREADPLDEPSATEGLRQFWPGARAGALIGGGIALVAGVVELLGPAAGPIEGLPVLQTVAAGALGGGLIGALIGATLLPPRTPAYRRVLRDARAVVTVAAGDRAAEVADALRRRGGQGVGDPQLVQFLRQEGMISAR